jgi:hypothetical protein
MLSRYSQHRMDKRWQIVQLFESCSCFIHQSIVSQGKIEDTPCSNLKACFLFQELPKTEYFYDAQMSTFWRLECDIQLEVLSISSGLCSVQPKYCIFCLLIAKWCHCRSSPKTIIYCMQGCKRIHHHRSNEYIMVLNALGGVNGRSRAAILRLDVDQYRQASLPDYLDDAQGACNCCAWLLPNQRIKLFKSRNWQDLFPGIEW